METSWSGNFLEPVKVTLARTPHNRGYGAWTGHLLWPGYALDGENRTPTQTQNLSTCPTFKKHWVVVAQSLWEWSTNDWSNLKELFLYEIRKKKSSFDIPIYYVTSLKTQNYKGQLDIASYKMMSQSQHSDLSTASLFWEMKYFIIYSNQFNRKYRAVYLMFFFKHIFSIKARMVHEHNIL